jgi:hypothetical protein
MFQRILSASRRQLFPPLSFLLIAIAALAAQPGYAAPPEIVLHGTIHGSQNHSYVEVPFRVPVRIERITVTFSYTGRQEHATLDLGAEDPERFRGWSGGNKSTFTIGVSDATPSYLPGPIPAGEWHLLIGVANLRADKSADYTATIALTPDGQAGVESFTAAPLSTEARWYRGDLHMHTAHSDGSCHSQSGKQVPCPLFVTAESAAAQGLDFIAITDHNTTSHYADERELQPYFDKLLFIPGREMTTVAGHANFYGSTHFVDFRTEAQNTPTAEHMFEAGRALGELVSINHPVGYDDERCIGCGWIGHVDMSKVNAIEAINGDDTHLHAADIAYWESQLARGYRLTAIGGSDTHRPDNHTIGHPTTVVFARELSVAAILDGIRAGHVFIDLTASHDRLLEMQASSGSTTAHMGDVLAAPAGAAVDLAFHVAAVDGSHLAVFVDGHTDDALLANTSIAGADQTLHASYKSDGHRHWIRAEVLSSSGNLQLLGNPIYLNQEKQ